MEIGNKYLYWEDVQSIVPVNASPSDSIEIVNNYIRKWSIEVLMYENAKKNTPNVQEIDKMVEEYRKSLIIHQYQQRLLEQRLDNFLTEAKMQQFYDTYGTQMLLKEPVIKGFFLVLPQNAPMIDDMRKWVSSGDEEALENIEKYQMQNAIGYDYFTDDWIPSSTLIKKLPSNLLIDVPAFVSRKYSELSDSTHCYLVHISDYRLTGQQQPYEVAKEEIANMLAIRAKTEFITGFESELYNDAVKDGKIVFLKENNPVSVQNYEE